VVTREEGAYVLRAYDNLGELAWGEELGAEGFPTHMTYAHVGGLEHEDLVFLYEADAGPTLEARDGTDGSLLVRVALSSIPGASLESRLLRLPGAQAEDFRDENEPDDLLMIHTQGATLLEGTTLAPIRSISTGPSAFLSSLVDIDGDGELDVLVQSPDGTRSARRLSNDEALWSTSPQPSHQGSPDTLAGLLFQGNDRTQGAHVAIGGAFGDLTLYDKATGLPLWSVCLAGGEVTVIPPGVTLDEAACAGAPLADITSARVDIGQQDTLLVGAGDGWGYALRADGSPVWALPFHRPLGPLIIADGNGDRAAEVVVTADNGSAYVLKGRFDPPAAIRDVALGDDGAPAMVEADINEQRHARGLAFAWEAVPGADRYGVAIVGDDDILRPLTEVGNVTSLAYTPEDAQLKPGATYYAVVQARSSAGQRSPLIASDGVTIVDDVAPTAQLQLLSESPLSPALDQVVALQVTAMDNMGLREVSLEATAEGADAPAWTRRWPGARAMTLSRQEIWAARDEVNAPLPDGVYTVTVEVEDYGDLRAAASLQVTLDSTPPPTPTWSAPSPDAALMDPLPTLTGATEPGAAVQVWLNDAPLCDAVADDAGAFSCAPTEPLPDGAYAATAQARDALGNASPVSDALRFSIDATAPAAPTIVEPADAEVLTPGVVTFVVRAEAGVAVTVSLGEEVACVTAEPLEGTDMYTCQSAQALEPGAYVATATASDEIGWTSPASASVTFTVMAEDANNGQNNGDPNNGNPNNGDPNNGQNNGANNGQNNGDPNNGDPNNGDPVNNGVNPNTDANNGDGPMVGVGAPSDDGCGCAVPTQRAPRGAALLGALLALGVAALRRRR
jgi:MYXO-CTERM domain-containing protein